MARGDGDAHVVQIFNGTDVSVATGTFTVQDQWEVAWFTPRPLNFTILTSDGHPVAGTHAVGRGSLYLSRGGAYYIQINSDHPEIKVPWQFVVAEIAGGTRLNGPGIHPMIAMGGDTSYAPLTTALPPGTGVTNQPQPGFSPSAAPSTSPGVASSTSSPFGAPPPAWGNTPSAAPVTPATPLAPAPAATAAAAPAAPTGTLTQDQARAIVLIKGDKAEGTGFMVKTMNGPVVITNIHVIANNPNVKITTNTGELVTVLSQKGAIDRDLAMLAIKDDGYSYLEMAPDISKVVQPGDAVVTPGNSEGGEVMLNTTGTVLGVGPLRVEISNPIYHGNSGGPVVHSKTGKVLGVVTEAEPVDLSDDLDKASFASRNSAIASKMRYFALRLDTVTQWIDVDPRVFGVETAFLDQFEQQSERLDAYLNRGDNNSNGNASSGGDNSKIYLDDEKIMRAENEYKGAAGGTDTAGHIDALRSLLFELQNVADSHMSEIQSMNNFYPFDQQRAKDEMAYRKALKDELDAISNNIERLGRLPRTNN